MGFLRSHNDGCREACLSALERVGGLRPDPKLVKSSGNIGCTGDLFVSDGLQKITTLNPSPFRGPSSVHDVSFNTSGGCIPAAPIIRCNVPGLLNAVDQPQDRQRCCHQDYDGRPKAEPYRHIPRWKSKIVRLPL